MSPFGYNETLAQQYFPLTQQQAEYMSYNWYKEETSSPSSSNVHSVPNTELSKNIDEVSDDIVNKIIVCEETSKPFRILKQELQFYRKH
jgi:hypothetical protein